MYLKITILFFFTCIVTAVKSQPSDCFKFKEGKFRIADTRAGLITIAERRGNYQTESSEALKVILRFSISWQNDCTYTLKLDKVLRNENKINFPANLEIHIKIIATSSKSYTQQISSPLTDGTYTVEAVKLD